MRSAIAAIAAVTVIAAGALIAETQPRCKDGCFEARIRTGGTTVSERGSAMLWDGDGGNFKLQLITQRGDPEGIVARRDGPVPDRPGTYTIDLAWPAAGARAVTKKGKLELKNIGDERITGSIEAAAEIVVGKQKLRTTITAEFDAVRFR